MGPAAFVLLFILFFVCGAAADCGVLAVASPASAQYANPPRGGTGGVPFTVKQTPLQITSITVQYTSTSSGT